MIDDYVCNRETLMNLFVLVDSRIKPMAIDLEFIAEAGRQGLPLSIVFTKTDKQNQSETAKNVNTFKQAMLEEWEELPPMFLTSSVSKTGRSKILEFIGSTIEAAKTPQN